MRISDWSSDVCSSDLLRVSRRYLIADGVDRVEIGGLPADALVLVDGHAQPVSEGISAAEAGSLVIEAAAPFLAPSVVVEGSEERRVGKECVSTCRCRRSPDH